MSIKDISGLRRGRLTVIKYVGKNKYGKSLWECKCDCGNTKVIVRDSLIKEKGGTRSCGCLGMESRRVKIPRTHGMTGTRIHRIWKNMKTRCYNGHDKFYYCYGGKGIKICDEWRNNFVPFYEWSMENGYTDELTIDRINSDGDYEPSNCRWVTMKVQNANSSNCHYVEYNGEKHLCREWQKILNVNNAKFYYWVNKLGSAEKAVEFLMVKGGGEDA